MYFFTHSLWGFKRQHSFLLLLLSKNQGRHDKTCAFIERTLCKVPNPHSSCNARSCTPFRTYGKTHKPCFSRHVAKGVQSRALKRSYATLVVRMIQHWYCVLIILSLVIVLTLRLHYVSASRPLKCTFGTFIEWLRGYAPTSSTIQHTLRLPIAYSQTPKSTQNT